MNPATNNIKLNISNPYSAPEFKGVTNWLNTNPLKMSDLKGKVVVIDFWTYSCINCIRTLPYLKQWYDKYNDKGLVIVGVHAPEFAFERVPENVADFVKDHDIKYPVVQDNDMQTWNEYRNQYWPAKYFIDKNGMVRHTHFGEGEYTESEMVIQQLLAEGDNSFTIDTEIKNDDTVPVKRGQTPETYLGWKRILYPPNPSEFKPDEIVNYSNVQTPASGWSLEGSWLISDEKLISKADGAKLKLNFSAKEVYLVMGSKEPSSVKVYLNGKLVDSTNKGDDVNNSAIVTVGDYKLYRIIKLQEFKTDQLLELEYPENVEMNAFTFGS